GGEERIAQEEVAVLHAAVDVVEQHELVALLDQLDGGGPGRRWREPEREKARKTTRTTQHRTQYRSVRRDRQRRPGRSGVRDAWVISSVVAPADAWPSLRMSARTRVRHSVSRTMATTASTQAGFALREGTRVSDSPPAASKSRLAR